MSVPRAEIIVRFSLKSMDDFDRIDDSEDAILTQFKILIDFIPTPPREKRILFDQYHSLNYPENGFISKDNIDEFYEEDPYEWLGDSLYTNFERFYSKLSQEGYYFEVLYQPLTCFDADNYKVLMLVDIEDYLSDTEMLKLREDIETKQLSLIVVADWYNKEKIESKKYFNIVTFEEWPLFMGGSNVPTLNELLHPYHIALG